MNEKDYPDMAKWAADALKNTQIIGGQAGNLIAVQEFLLRIAAGELVVHPLSRSEGVE